VLMTIEHSPPQRRGFYGSIVQIGFPLGMVIGTASFFALAKLDDTQFTRWGWRLPFLASAALVIVGTFIRLRIEETPDFTRNVREGKIVRFPLLDTIRRHPKDLFIGLGARITEMSWIYVITTRRKLRQRLQVPLRGAIGPSRSCLRADRCVEPAESLQRLTTASSRCPRASSCSRSG
jgi:MFS family permease